ncbi:hypothetical protein SKAU_G00249580 [Synaphobranchus kaupii]|uniref:Uncharacterized protein n=1 Tax=Synaphobranchus kaupii TaxID=118154 RepID=A0A9Q1F2L2_SYNKA|nr:hypothetical protein SKAU_G00249580 [Synaphobranchus kaupii]
MRLGSPGNDNASCHDASKKKVTGAWDVEEGFPVLERLWSQPKAPPPGKAMSADWILPSVLHSGVNQGVRAAISAQKLKLSALCGAGLKAPSRDVLVLIRSFLSCSEKTGEVADQSRERKSWAGKGFPPPTPRRNGADPERLPHF